MCPETLENDAPEGPKWRQNGSKMTPWRPLGDLWAPTLLPEAPRSPPGGALGRPGGPKNSLLAPWGPPGAESWSISGLRGVPGRPPEGPGEAPGGHFGGHCSSRALEHEKSEENNEFSLFLEAILGLLFVSISSSSWRRRRESAPRKNMKSHWFYRRNLLVRLSRAAKK